MNRKETTDEMLKKHLPIFRILKIPDPFFTLKSAYFISGKKGKFIQLFESELSKDKDLYIEFVNKDLSPDTKDRVLFKLRNNPFYKEEYEMENKTTEDGREYSVYIIPVAELRVVLPNGTELSYMDYEAGLFTIQESSPFPNFEEEFSLLTNNEEIADAPLSEMTIRDLAAIMLMRPVSSKPWLNDIVKQSKSDI